MTGDDHIPARPHYLELDLPDGPQRIYLGHFHNDGKPTPPPEKWRQICQCQKNYVPRQGALCHECVAMYRAAEDFAREMTREEDDADEER